MGLGVLHHSRSTVRKGSLEGPESTSLLGNGHTASRRRGWKLSALVAEL